MCFKQTRGQKGSVSHAVKIIKILCNNSIINVIKLDSKDSDEESSSHETERELLILNDNNNKENI